MMHLGPEAFEAVNNLKNNRDWKVFKEALVEQMNRVMNAAVDAGADRDMIVGYARAVRDIVATVQTIEEGPQRGGKPQRPTVEARHAAVR